MAREVLSSGFEGSSYLRSRRSQPEDGTGDRTAHCFLDGAPAPYVGDPFEDGGGIVQFKL